MSGATPQLRFPGFKGDWSETTVGEIGPVLMCKRVLKEQTSFNGDVPFYKIGTFGRDADAFISQELFDDFRRRYPYPNFGDILISAAGTIGRLVVFDGHPAYFQDSNIVWVANDETRTLNAFLYYCYQNTNWTTEDTTIARLYNNNLRGVEFAQPSLVEQRKITDFLGAVDAKLDTLRRKKSTLKAFRLGLMQRMFSQELRFLRDDGTAFPDWENKALGDIGTFIKGKGISKAHIDADGDLPCIRYGEIYTHYSERITEVLSSTNVSPSELVLSDINDVIIPASGETPIDMARACCVLVPGVALGGDINIFRGSLNGEFLAYFLTHARRLEIAQVAQGNSVVHLYPAQLRKILVAVPHPDEQRKIASALSAIDSKITAVADQIVNMETFKRGLLQQMFV